MEKSEIKTKVIRIVPLCRLPKKGHIIPKGDLADIVESAGIQWDWNEALHDGKVQYESFYDWVKVKITRCKVIEVEYVPERTNNFREYIEDGLITRRRDLTMDDLKKIYRELGWKYKHLDHLYYTGYDYQNIITI